VRVAYLINEYPKVTHTFVRTEIAALEQAGVQVDRITIRPSRMSMPDAADQQEREKTRVILAVGVSGLLASLLRTAVTNPQRFARALRMAWQLGRQSARGVSYHLAYLAEACVLVRWFAAQPVDRLHAHFGTNPAAVALLSRLLGGPSYSFTVHGPEEFTDAPRLGLRDKVEHADFVVVVSEAGRANLQRLCPSHCWQRLHVVRCGIDARFQSRPPTPVPAARRIVFVGRLCAEKAPLLLLEAVARLRSAGEECELVMVGDGPLRAALEERLRALGLEKQVRLVGWASGDDVQQHILAARALVLPSFAEGLPVVLMEALALHRPVICTPVGGVAELLEDSVSGWLVPPGQVDALAAAIRAALSASPLELEQMGRRGAARVQQQHDAMASGRQLAALFRGEVTGPPP
jgi:glycosyltransferase involved in cell wall biosynthesis